MAIKPVPGPAKASATLDRLKANGDIKLPAFRPLAELALVTDDDSLKREMLARLDWIYDKAMNRERTVGKDQNIILDPDSHSACKVVEIASEILGVKVGKRPTGGVFDATIFDKPAKEAS